MVYQSFDPDDSSDPLTMLVNYFLRPARKNYTLDDLGSTDLDFEGLRVQREDITLKNPRGHELVCSLYTPFQPELIHPPTLTPAKSSLPKSYFSVPHTPSRCVIYLHRDGQNRLEAASLFPLILPYNCSLFTMDFSGSGLSEGTYISLGWHEQFDIATAIDFLTNEKQVQKIILWGRSMGAAAAIMYAGANPQQHARVEAMVLDSPYESFHALAENMVNDVSLPKFVPRKMIMTTGMRFLRRRVKEMLAFDVEDVRPIVSAKKCRMPVLLIHGQNDVNVPLSHSQNLLKNFASTTKNLIVLEGLNSESNRPPYAKEKAFSFIQSQFFRNELIECIAVLTLRAVHRYQARCYEDAINHFTEAIKMIEAEHDADHLKVKTSYEKDGTRTSERNILKKKISTDQEREPTRTPLESPREAKKGFFLFRKNKPQVPTEIEESTSLKALKLKDAKHGGRSGKEDKEYKNKRAQRPKSPHRKARGLTRKTDRDLQPEQISETAAIEILHHLYLERSSVFHRWQRGKQALEDAECSISFQSNSSRGYVHKASAHHLLGDVKLASEAVHKALTINPQCPDSQKLKAELDTLQEETI